MKVMSKFFKNDLITILAHYYTLITSNSYIYVCYEKIIKKLVIFTGVFRAIINKPF